MRSCLGGNFRQAGILIGANPEVHPWQRLEGCTAYQCSRGHELLLLLSVCIPPPLQIVLLQTSQKGILDECMTRQYETASYEVIHQTAQVPLSLMSILFLPQLPLPPSPPFKP